MIPQRCATIICIEFSPVFRDKPDRNKVDVMPKENCNDSGIKAWLDRKKKDDITFAKAVTQNIVDFFEGRRDETFQIKKNYGFSALNALLNDEVDFSCIKHGNVSDNQTTTKQCTKEEVIEYLVSHIDINEVPGVLRRRYELKNGEYRRVWEIPSMRKVMLPVYQNLLKQQNKPWVVFIAGLVTALFCMALCISCILLFGFVILAKGYTPAKIYKNIKESLLGRALYSKCEISKEEYDRLLAHEKSARDESDEKIDTTPSEGEKSYFQQGNLIVGRTGELRPFPACEMVSDLDAPTITLADGKEETPLPGQTSINKSQMHYYVFLTEAQLERRKIRSMFRDKIQSTSDKDQKNSLKTERCKALVTSKIDSACTVRRFSTQ